MHHTPNIVRRICVGIAFLAFGLLHSLHAQTTPTPAVAPADTMAQDSPVVEGVKKTDIHIERTDLLHFAKFGKDSVKIRKLIGNVKLRQDSTIIYCDSAMQFIDTSLIVAKGHVVINMEGNRTIYADNLTYQGDTKVLSLDRNVRLKDSSITLYTDKMTYYRIPNFGEYTTGGKLVSKENTLTSRKGYYYPDNSMAYFKEDVKLVNPDYTLSTDTLGYNTDTRIAFFLAPTWVKDSLNSMYTEDGYYDTENDFAYLHTNAQIGDKTYTLFADTIQYDQAADLGRAIGHVIAEQKDSSMTVFGKYAEFESKTESTYITDSTFAFQVTNQDTLYLYADTLSTYTDTITDKRFFFCYRNTRIYKDDIQGICDSLAYWYDDSVMIMYHNPILWSDSSQISGDTIGMMMKDGGLDSMYIPSSPMIASKEDTIGFDQIKGEVLSAKFKDKQLHKMYVTGSSQSVYYTKDEKEKYIGMNVAKCADMFIQFKDNKPSSILFSQQPEGTFYPVHLITDEKKTLEGFRWLSEFRPKQEQWACDMVNLRYGPRDSFALSLDSINRTLLVVQSNLEVLLSELLGQPADGATTDSLSDSLSNTLVDTLNGIPVDTNSIDSLPNLNPLKGQGSEPETAMHDFQGAGNRRKEAKAEKRGLLEKLKMMFAEKEIREEAKLQKQIRKVSRKADREEKHRYDVVEKVQRKKIDQVDHDKVNFSNPRLIP